MQPCLPVELLKMIVDDVYCFNALLQLRAASWTMCALATPAAFRTVGATNTMTSAESLRRVLERKELAQHVREIVYEDDLAKITPLMGPNPLARRDVEVQHLLVDALTHIPALPNLDTLTLTFYPGCNGVIPAKHMLKPCLLLQTSILAAAASTSHVLANRLKHLNLNGMLPQYHPVYETEPFRTLICSVPSVRITTSPALPHFAPWYDFWFHNLQTDILDALVHSTALTSLELHFLDHEAVDLDELAFPALKRISVPCSVEMDVDDFIARHAQLEQWDNSLRVWRRESGWASFRPQVFHQMAAEFA